MKNNKNEFLEEITTNFSNLFVETFIIRYLNEYNKKYLYKNFIKAKKILNKKIAKIIKLKLKK